MSAAGGGRMACRGCRTVATCTDGQRLVAFLNVLSEISDYLMSLAFT